MSSLVGLLNPIHFLLLTDLAKPWSALPLHHPLFTHRPPPVHCHSFTNYHTITFIHSRIQHRPFTRKFARSLSVSFIHSHVMSSPASTDRPASSSTEIFIHLLVCLIMHALCSIHSLHYLSFISQIHPTQSTLHSDLPHPKRPASFTDMTAS